MDNGQLRNPFGMIIKRQNMSENQWNHFKIVPQGHDNCQLSIVNCQFGEAAKFQFIVWLRESNISYRLSHSRRDHRTDFAYSVGVMPNFSLNCREK